VVIRERLRVAGAVPGVSPPGHKFAQKPFQKGGKHNPPKRETHWREKKKKPKVSATKKGSD